MNRHVYRCYDENLNLLYVGSSLYFQSRVQGLRGNDWFKHVAYIRLEKYRSKFSMLKAEMTAIQTELPKYNINGTPKRSAYLKKLKQLNNLSEANKLKADKVKK
mgnify:CR=1 FL=1